MLSGTAPLLAYARAESFEGLDSFDFRVSDGVNTSALAEVTIAVCTGTETVPPQVLYTVPEDSATHVWVHEMPVYPGVYAPSIIVQSTEPSARRR